MQAALVLPLKNFQLGCFRWKLCREFSQEQTSGASQPVVMLVWGATILRITLVKHKSQKAIRQNEPRTLWCHQHMLNEEAHCHPLRTSIVVTSKKPQTRIFACAMVRLYSNGKQRAKRLMQ